MAVAAVVADPENKDNARRGVSEMDKEYTVCYYEHTIHSIYHVSQTARSSPCLVHPKNQNLFKIPRHTNKSATVSRKNFGKELNKA